LINKIEKLINLLKMFPGVGDKSARRMAYNLLNRGENKIDQFSKTVADLKNIKKCNVCGVFSEDDLCKYCSSSLRNRDVICVVEEFYDVEAIENTGVYNGLYHILGGHVSPVDGVFLKDLNIDSLIERIDESINEVIIATNPNLEGEATANYLRDLLDGYDIKISKLATGLPMGGDLSILNSTTIKNSLKNRSNN